jgi:hypothetical protein
MHWSKQRLFEKCRWNHRIILHDTGLFSAGVINAWRYYIAGVLNARRVKNAWRYYSAEVVNARRYYSAGVITAWRYYISGL